MYNTISSLKKGQDLKCPRYKGYAVCPVATK